jgi:hypothetical protein
MDLHRIIAELQQERRRIDEAIEALERLAAAKTHRRGRPPAWLKDEIQRQTREMDTQDEPESDKT